MPRLHVLSDLHSEFSPFEPQLPDDVDVVVLAGDIDRGQKGIDWARAAFPQLPIVYVAGNHEYYGHAIPHLTAKLKAYASERDVTFLENDVAELSGVRFVGCTLWTDLTLLGSEPWREHEIAQRMSDYRHIRVSPQYRRLRPQDTAFFHARSRRWLAEAARGGSPTVVVTHHAPSQRSVNPLHATEVASAAYASNLDDLVVELGPAVWIHGHTHHNVDYRIGSTRVLSNQRGYVPDEMVPDFNSSLAVSV